MNRAEMQDMSSAIMPLSETRKEVNEIMSFIKYHDLNSARKNIAEHIDVQKIRQILLIGSGDSYALALLYAAVLNNITLLPARAIQSYEFVSEKTDYLDSAWLVIVLSASGRVSPVLDVLTKAQHSQAQVLGITNNNESRFAILAQKCVFTQASKKGMPTQSTLAMALFLDALACVLHPAYEKKHGLQLQHLRLYAMYAPVLSRLALGDELLLHLFSRRITLLGSGGNLGLATLFSNLLWCGPQLASQVFPLEEYEHALRLNQASDNDLIIIFDCTATQGVLAYHIRQKLMKNNATVVHVDNGLLSLMFSGSSRTFSGNGDCRYYAMLFIFSLIISATEMFLSCGGKRVTE
ncbi:SIS domain-containing protein [Trabulsiella odontotermitis]|uniref:SIS domain-containing protein n=1 Tax=Trabulsiella odontotermitis TaxID=379893 RepID=UPI0009B9400D|nr:SIS domain-containing protein [Trabulsiella odontotermitis]